MSSLSMRLKLWNACLGNLFEHYDTALFGFLSPFLAPLIFPEHDPLTALILTYAIIPLGMLARPVGALVFGYIGDTYGRERALFLTLAGMALISGVIAWSPTYAQAGIFAPLIFCLGRVLQNFLAAGETMGGAVFLLENSSEKLRNMLSSLYNMTAVGGHLLASLGVFLLSRFFAVDHGWRFLYVFGCITALFGCLIRLTAQPLSAPVHMSQSFAALKSTLWNCHKPLLCVIVSAGFAHANYSMALVLMNGWVPLVSSLTKTQMMQINTYLLIFDVCAFPFFGWLLSKLPRERLMLAAALGVALCSLPLLLSLRGASLTTAILVRAAFVLFGVAFFAPFHAWAQQLMPSHCRYAVISFGYAVGSQLLGSPTAALGLWCFKKTGMASSVGWYWMVLGLATSVVILATMRSRSFQENVS